MFHSQFEAVDRPTPRERIGRGKISPMRICSPVSTGAIESHQGESAYPCTGAPRGSEEEDEDGDEGNLSVDGREVVCNIVARRVVMNVVEPNGHTNDCD